jgi:hypothetical protein
MFHCHCQRCRKAHGAAFATYTRAPLATVALAGTDAIVSFADPAPGASPRSFCRHCGSVVPYAFGDTMFFPAGNFDGDPVARPALHMFAGSRAPWYAITDALPSYTGFPAGSLGAPVEDLAPRDPPGRPRGSCLCGAITYVLEDQPRRRRYCHCSRCRKGLSAAHAANLRTTFAGVTFVRGADHATNFKVPDARHFTQSFCPTCGSPVPRRDDPRVPASGHIFVGSKAAWFDITDELPQHQAYPPEA